MGAPLAFFTPLSLDDASRLTQAQGLGPCSAVEPIAAGSVNSNFFVDTARGRRFLRIYEEQLDDAGIAYEWALLDHLRASGLPVPVVVPGVAPGALRVDGKPTALFELVHGEESCQARVTTRRAEVVGETLAAVHVAGSAFGWRRRGRFGVEGLFERLDRPEVQARTELAAVSARLRATIAEAHARLGAALPVSVVHGDMFRDNVLWEGDRVVAIIDWESASEGVCVYDLAVTLHAWCYGAHFEWELARALVRGYEGRRPLAPEERAALRDAMRLSASRFAVTRITDFYLRAAAAAGGAMRETRDYRRFVARLDAVEALDARALVARLCG